MKDELDVYKEKYLALLFGAMSIISMALAIVLYENSFTLLEPIIKYDGQTVNDSFLLSSILFANSILMAMLGFIYSIMKKRVVGLLLSATVFAALCFVYVKTKPLNGITIEEGLKKIELVKKF